MLILAPADTPRPNNEASDQRLRELMTTFLAAGVAVQMMSPHHLKYGPWNYYPKRGVIHRDGEATSEAIRGPEHFIECCRRDFYIPDAQERS